MINSWLLCEKINWTKHSWHNKRNTFGELMKMTTLSLKLSWGILTTVRGVRGLMSWRGNQSLVKLVTADSPPNFTPRIRDILVWKFNQKYHLNFTKRILQSYLFFKLICDIILLSFRCWKHTSYGKTQTNRKTEI